MYRLRSVRLDRTHQRFAIAFLLCVVAIQAPIVTTIVSQPRALSLGGWDWATFAYLTALLFIALPFSVFLLIEICHRVSGSILTYSLFAFVFSFILTNQIAFDPIFESVFPRLRYAFILFGILLIGLFLARNVLKYSLFPMIISSVGLFVYLLILASPSKISFEIEYQGANLPKNIFLLTFEKLSWSYIKDADDNVDAMHFPNLSDFVNRADLYIDAHAVSSQTYIALKSLYSGRYLGAKDDVSGIPNIINIAENTHNIVYMNDVNSGLCKPDIHRCVSSMGGSVIGCV